MSFHLKQASILLSNFISNDFLFAQTSISDNIRILCYIPEDKTKSLSAAICSAPISPPPANRTHFLLPVITPCSQSGWLHRTPWRTHGLTLAVKSSHLHSYSDQFRDWHLTQGRFLAEHLGHASASC